MFTAMNCRTRTHECQSCRHRRHVAITLFPPADAVERRLAAVRFSRFAAAAIIVATLTPRFIAVCRCCVIPAQRAAPVLRRFMPLCAAFLLRLFTLYNSPAAP